MFNGLPMFTTISSLRVRFAVRSMPLCFGLLHKEWCLLSTVCLLRHPRGDFHKTSLSACWDLNASYTMCVFFRSLYSWLHFGDFFSHPLFKNGSPTKNIKKLKNHRWKMFFILFVLVFWWGGKCQQHEDGWPSVPSFGSEPHDLDIVLRQKSWPWRRWSCRNGFAKW